MKEKKIVRLLLPLLLMLPLLLLLPQIRKLHKVSFQVKYCESILQLNWIGYSIGSLAVSVLLIVLVPLFCNV